MNQANSSSIDAISQVVSLRKWKRNWRDFFGDHFSFTKALSQPLQSTTITDSFSLRKVSFCLAIASSNRRSCAANEIQKLKGEGHELRIHSRVHDKIT